VFYLTDPAGKNNPSDAAWTSCYSSTASTENVFVIDVPCTAPYAIGVRIRQYNTDTMNLAEVFVYGTRLSQPPPPPPLPPAPVAGYRWWPPPSPSPTPTCHDLDLAGTLLDVDGDNCAFYTANPSYCTDSWLYDDYLSASAMCCACGGGALMPPSPPLSPSPPPPSPSPPPPSPSPPAPRPPLVQCDYYSHSTTNDPNEAYGPLYKGTSVSTVALIGDLQYAKDACTEHSECDAFSTQQIDASLSNYRKIWLKKVRGDAGDAEGLETWLSGNTWERNINWNFYYANELCSKVSPPPSPPSPAPSFPPAYPGTRTTDSYEP
jgi:hypothetical protein